MKTEHAISTAQKLSFCEAAQEFYRVRLSLFRREGLVPFRVDLGFEKFDVVKSR